MLAVVVLNHLPVAFKYLTARIHTESGSRQLKDDHMGSTVEWLALWTLKDDHMLQM